MRLASIKVENFRAHTSTNLPLSQLGCLIGENNAGKSTILHAIQFVLEEKKLDEEDFRDPEAPIKVTLRLEDIVDGDLQRITEEQHRNRVREMIVDGKLTIVRTQAYGAKADSQYLKLTPKNENWTYDALKEAITGTTLKTRRSAAINQIPELAPFLPDETVAVAAVTDAWNKFVQGLPATALVETPAPFPTGITQAVKPLYPSVIYIEAVKDASIEAKATGSAAFSKLLKMLFEEIRDEFSDIDKQFAKVHKKLNQPEEDEARGVDERLEAVQTIESTLERYIQSSFPGVRVRMNVPPPTLSMLLDQADLFVDDGHESYLSSKGDGLKRTVLFALLRAYTSLKDTGFYHDDQASNKKHAYVLLFEEPELYLHPRAQRQLMAALEDFSQDHQVLVTTHSPGFFRPGTKGFARLRKTSGIVEADPVDLDVSLRDAYQLVQHENNEAAFFAHQVVLVEGDSDTFVYPHLAKLLSKDWDAIEHNIVFVKIGGKTNIKRYREFFSSFNVPVHVIADLDALSDGFDQLTDTKAIQEAHATLMSKISESLTEPSPPNSKKLKSIVENRSRRELWVEAQRHLENWRTAPTNSIAEELDNTLTELFDQGSSKDKLAELQSPSSDDIVAARGNVISALAQENVYVLQRGELEAYCRTSATSDKVTTAMNFCEKTRTLEDFEQIHEDDAASVVEELRGIFQRIYCRESTELSETGMGTEE